MDKKLLFKKAVMATTPVLAGYIALGMGFGILLSTKGYSVWWALAMAVTIYAGSMQYLAIDLLAGGASLITAALTTLLVNARHLFYGISMVDKYKGAGKKKAYMIFALTDETYSLVCNGAPEGVEDQHKYFFIVSVCNQIYWITGCVLGAVVGSLITFNVEGIDFVLTALFVTVFVEQWISNKDHSSAIIGVVASVLCLVIFGENFLIAAMIAITLALTILKKVRKGGKQDV